MVKITGEELVKGYLEKYHVWETTEGPLVPRENIKEIHISVEPFEHSIIA